MSTVALGAGPNRRLLAGLAAALLVLVAAAAVLSRNGSGSAPPAPAAPAVPAEPAAPPRAAPVPDLTFVDYLGVTQLPVSRTAGPRDLGDGRAHGFARSDLGAALAAVHLLTRANAGVGPDIFEPTIREQVYGPDRDALLAVSARQYRDRLQGAGVAAGEPLVGAANRRAGVPGGRNVRGYRLAPGSDDATRSVHVLITAPDPQTGRDVLLDFRVAVSWRDGDWRLQAPWAGDWGTAATRVDGAAEPSYTAYGG